jgi:hypothetical protein
MGLGGDIDEWNVKENHSLRLTNLFNNPDAIFFYSGWKQDEVV